jgi:hypothetical protein
VIAGDQFVATCEAKSAGCINMPESISSDGGEEEEDADPKEVILRRTLYERML